MAMTLWAIGEAERLGIRDAHVKHPDPCLARFVPSGRSLIHRGLVEWKDTAPGYAERAWTLTEAGKHVLELCRLAGIVPQKEVNDAISKEPAQAA